MILATETNRRQVDRYDIFEVTAAVRARFENPFRAGDIRVELHLVSPSGRNVTARGFYDQQFVRVKGHDRGELRPAGKPRWKVRFAPDEAGAWSYRLIVATRGGTARSEPGQFLCTPGNLPGPARVAKSNPRRFAYADGSPCLPIGMNVCWAAGGKQPFKTYLDAMSKAGCNYARVWLCSWDLAFEGKRLDDYRLDTAQRLDELFEYAAGRGIGIQLCIDNFSDFVKGDKATLNPYWRRNGGPGADVPDFFRNERAAAHYERKLAYLAARYGAHANLFAWELWNEMNLLTEARQPRYMIEWTKRMTAFLRAADGGRHLITTSIAGNDPWLELWSGSGVDFAQVHVYIPHPEQINYDAELDAAELILSRIGPFEDLPMPVIVGEYGFKRDGEVNLPEGFAADGTHIHNAMWAAAMGGSAGGVMPWWWDKYIHPTNQYRHFTAVAKFCRDLDLNSPDWRIVADHFDGQGRVRVIGWKTQTRGAFWIRRLGNGWYDRLIEKSAPRMLHNVIVRIPGLADGRYRAEWVDTATGKVVKVTFAATDAGVLQLNVPVQAPDVALKTSMQ